MRDENQHKAEVRFLSSLRAETRETFPWVDTLVCHPGGPSGTEELISQCLQRRSDDSHTWSALLGNCLLLRSTPNNNGLMNEVHIATPMLKFRQFGVLPSFSIPHGSAESLLQMLQGPISLCPLLCPALPCPQPVSILRALCK